MLGNGNVVNKTGMVPALMNLSLVFDYWGICTILFNKYSI